MAVLQIEPSMNPRNINWKKWLGVEEGLAEYEDFDRAKYRQWPFLAVRFWNVYGLVCPSDDHDAEGDRLAFSGRVVGAGGIYLEHDGRDAPDRQRLY